MKVDEKFELLDKLEDYKGNNTYILWLQYVIKKDEKFKMNNFHYNYLKNNYDTKPKEINKVIEIADWYSEKKKDEWEVKFTPERIKITHLMGEVGGLYHCFALFKQNQERPKSVFIPKNAIITPLDYIHYDTYDLDVDNLNNILNEQTKGKRRVLEHQPDAIKFLLHTRKCILADDMGLAKTSSTIAASVAGGFKKVLVICPASVKSTWKREIGYFMDAEEHVNIVNGSEWGETKKYNIINFEILKNFYILPLEPKTKKVRDVETGKLIEIPVTKNNKHPKTKKVTQEIVYKKSRKPSLIEKTLKESHLLLEKFDLIIIDEAHKLSNTTANRYQIIEDFIERSNIKDVYCLTGTPITNRPLNYYNILKLINADITHDWNFFMTRYCDGKEITVNGRKIMKTGGSSNLEELKKRTAHLYLRRLKTEIPDFPNKYIKEYWYDLSVTEKLEYDNIWNEYKQEQLENNVDIDVDTLESYKALIENTILRKHLANIMVSRTIELVEEHIEDGNKIIIGTTYDEELKLFKEYFGKRCVTYHGKMTIKKKDEAEHKFMNDDKIDVFIGQQLSAGVGITLTAANIVVFNSYDWIPGNNEQFQDRAFRIGQKKDVMIYYQNFENTILERMYNTVKEKEYIIDSVIVEEKEKNL